MLTAAIRSAGSATTTQTATTTAEGLLSLVAGPYASRTAQPFATGSPSRTHGPLERQPKQSSQFSLLHTPVRPFSSFRNDQEDEPAPPSARAAALGPAAGDGPQDPRAVTAVEFDETGDLVAVGDKGGRVCLLERGADNNTNAYDMVASFRSHDAEFDYLKSLEIEEKINACRFLSRSTSRHVSLLTTNDKTIKLWRVSERDAEQVHFFPRQQSLNNEKGMDGDDAAASSRRRRTRGDSPRSLADEDREEDDVVGGRRRGARRRRDGERLLQFPRVVKTGRSSRRAEAKRVFANAHAYHVHSIAPCADGESFLSADDLRVNLWHLEVNSSTFNVVDLKPANMEDLSEVITSAAFHPTRAYHLMYASSKGAIKLFDLRVAARCESPHQTLIGSGGSASFDDDDDDASSGGTNAASAQSRGFFSEIVSSISDARFAREDSQTPHAIVARDYLTVKVWDARKSDRPTNVVKVHDHLKSRLSDLYDSDRIFDKFDATPLNGAKSLVATGSYANACAVFDYATGDKVDLAFPGGAASNPSTHGSAAMPPNFRSLDLDKRALRVAAHPTRPVVAVAAQDGLHLFDLDQRPRAGAWGGGAIRNHAASSPRKQRDEYAGNGNPFLSGKNGHRHASGDHLLTSAF